MPLYRDEVIVIKSRDFGEKDKIFTLFGRRKGRFGAIAKSVRRAESRKGGHLQTFNVCKISCATGRSLDIVTEVESIIEIDPKTLKSEEFERLGFLSLILDKFLPECVPEPELYEKMKNFVQSDFSEENTRKIIVDILQRLGFSDKRQENLSFEKLKLYVNIILDRA
jgi:DNA repair protein RecO